MKKRIGDLVMDYVLAPLFMIFTMVVVFFDDADGAYTPLPEEDVVKFKLTNGATLPAYQTEGAAGFDLAAAGFHVIPPHARGFLVPTGLFAEIPDGYEMQIRSRSGIAARTALRISNGVGTVDSDYRGEIKILFDNLGDESYYMNHGDRVAQAVIAEVVQLDFTEVATLSDTKRGSGGMGSTGK